MKTYRSPKDIDAAFADGRPIDRALALGVQEAVRRHKLLGNPIAVWQDGQVRWLPPDEIPATDVAPPQPS